MSREVEYEEGICDACHRKTTVWDFMGDYLCAECIAKYIPAEEGEDDEL